MATCPDCGKPVTIEGGFVVTQEQSATCTCKATAKIASEPIPTPQRRSIEKEKGLLTHVAALATTELEDGTQAIIFALGTMAATSALSLLYFGGDRWGRSVLVFFFASLVLAITVCLGLRTAVRGYGHRLRRERVLATVGTVMLVVTLLYLALVTLVETVPLLWRSLGGGWTPFI